MIDEFNDDLSSFRSLNTFAEAKKMYRKLSKKYHPDINKISDTYMKQINADYEVLDLYFNKNGALVFTDISNENVVIFDEEDEVETFTPYVVNDGDINFYNFECEQHHMYVILMDAGIFYERRFNVDYFNKYNEAYKEIGTLLKYNNVSMTTFTSFSDQKLKKVRLEITKIYNKYLKEALKEFFVKNGITCKESKSYFYKKIKLKENKEFWYDDINISRLITKCESLLKGKEYEIAKMQETYELSFESELFHITNIITTNSSLSIDNKNALVNKIYSRINLTKNVIADTLIKEPITREELDTVIQSQKHEIIQYLDSLLAKQEFSLNVHNICSNFKINVEHTIDCLAVTADDKENYINYLCSFVSDIESGKIVISFGLLDVIMRSRFDSLDSLINLVNSIKSTLQKTYDIS